MKAGESQEVKSARLAYGVTNRRATGTAMGDKRTSQNNASSHGASKPPKGISPEHPRFNMQKKGLKVMKQRSNL